MRTRTLLSVLALVVVAGASDWTTLLRTHELSRNYDEDVFEKAGRGSEATLRRIAAQAAGRIRDARAVPLLIRLTRDPVASVRRAALFALGQIGSGDTVIPLRDALSRLPDADLPQALEALGKTRDPRAVTSVASYLRNASVDLRSEAALALFRLGDESTLPDLFAALLEERHEEPRWRLLYSAFRLLRAKQRRTGKRLNVDAAWTKALQEATAAQRPFQERVFATLALGAIDDQIEFVLALLRDEDNRVVIAAIRAVRGAWDEEFWKTMSAELANHDDALVREEWIRWLIAMYPKDKAKAPRQAQIIHMALESGAHGARVRGWTRLELLAREAAASIGAKVAVDWAKEAVDGKTWDEELAWRVNSYFPEKLPDTLPKTIKGKVAAADVCGEKRVPTKRALEVLAALLKDPDFVVRASAIASIAKRKETDFAPAIVAAAKDAPGTQNADVRAEAANALAALAEYDPWLREAAADDPDKPVRDAARAALKKFGRELPPEPPTAGFSLNGHDASHVLKAARALQGARVTLETNRGRIVMMLLPDEAPVHCVNFAALVRRKFYDGKVWHRVVADFVIQGGCPRGDGWGGPGYTLPDEIGTRPYVRGTVGMPKAGDDTGGCQIFITHLPTPHLDGRYSVYAQVIEGLHVVDRIRVGDRIVKATLSLPQIR